MPARKGDGLKKESVCVVNQEELGTMGNKYDGLCRAIAGAKRKKKKTFRQTQVGGNVPSRRDRLGSNEMRSVPVRPLFFSFSSSSFGPQKQQTEPLGLLSYRNESGAE